MLHDSREDPLQLAPKAPRQKPPYNSTSSQPLVTSQVNKKKNAQL